MNSSTKPPNMANSRKFQFDNDFEVEEVRHEAPVEAAEPAYVAPVFSEDDIGRAKDEAFKQGLEQGLAQARQSVDNTLLAVIDNAIGQMETLLAADQARTQQAQEIALSTAIATIKKIWPNVMNEFGLPMVEATIRQSMEYNPEESRIVVRVHDTMLDAVVKRLPQLQDQQAFAGKVIVLADESVIAGDCKVEWADGGLERISRSLSQQIDSALERILSSLSNPSQNADPERISS